MKKTTTYILVSLIFVLLSTHHLSNAQSLLGGLFQCAKNTDLDTVAITVCHCGKTIPTQKHKTSIPKISYEIPKYNDQNIFYILITPTAIHHELKESQDKDIQQNTVDHLKVDPDTTYLFYKLELVQDESAAGTYYWNITQEILPENLQIPDSTIIVTYLPHYVKAIKGGNNLELPTIYIDNHQSNRLETENDSEDDIIRLQLTALDMKALHVPTKQKIKSDSRRVMIMDTIV